MFIIELQNYSSTKIGENLHLPDINNRSTFKSVSDYVEAIRENLEDDNRKSRKNIDYLKESLKIIDENNREDLSSLTKEYGNKIISIYDNLADAINLQKSENLKLQMEIYNIQKHKNELNHEIKLLVNQVRKLENLLGVKRDTKFDNIVNINIKN